MFKSWVKKLLFFLILVLFPLGQLARLKMPFLPESIRLQPIEILVSLFGLIWLVEIIVKKKPLHLPIFFKEMLLFFAVALFSYLANFWTNGKMLRLPSFLYLLRLGNLFLFYPALADFFRENSVKKAPRYLFFSGLAVGVLTFLQYLVFPDTRFLYLLGWDDHYYRAIGLFFDPSFTGQIMVLAIILNIYFWLEKEKTKDKAVLVMSCLFLVMVLGLTFARASYLSLLIGLFGITAFLQKRWLFPALACALMAIVLLAPKPAGEGVKLLRSSSILARGENYLQGIEIIKKNFWFGVGYNNLRETKKDFGFLPEKEYEQSNSGAGLDNSFLFVFATTGIFGIIAYLFFWGKVGLKAVNSARSNKKALLVLASLLGVFCGAFFNNVLFYPWVIIWLFVLIAGFTVEN